MQGVPFDTKTQAFCTGTSFFPDMNVTALDEFSFFRIQPPDDHWKFFEIDSMEEFVSVVNGSYTEVCRCWRLKEQE